MREILAIVVLVITLVGCSAATQDKLDIYLDKSNKAFGALNWAECKSTCNQKCNQSSDLLERLDCKMNCTTECTAKGDDDDN